MITKMKVAIIGGGPSGLCAAKHLYHNKFNQFEITIFEEQENIGGTWIYRDDQSRRDRKLFQSAVYKHLKVDLPKQVMCYPDYPFPEETPTFPHHTAVLKYIQDYAMTYDVIKFVRFNTKVEIISPLNQNTENNFGFIKWQITTRNILSNKKSIEIYDAVFVCNGHYSVPHIPTITGIECFNGDILHSKSYNCPEDFKNKTVLVVGYGASALDIVVQLCETCKFIFISKRNKKSFLTLKEHANVKEVENIAKILEDGQVLFEDGTKLNVDVLLFCTGYIYSYPFLSKDCNIEVKENGKVVTPLYKHVFHINYPSMVFIGLCYTISVLPMIHQQCAFVVSVLNRKTSLPSKIEMEHDNENELKILFESGQPYSKFHSMPISQFSYNDELAEHSGERKNPPIMKKLFLYTVQLMVDDCYTFKSKEFKQVDESTFTILK